MAKIEKIFGNLQDKSILSIAPALRKVLLEHGEIVIYEAGDYLCRQNDPIYRLLIPISHPIKLIRKKFDGESSSDEVIGYLQENRSLCLHETMFNEVAPYSAVAEVSTSVLETPAIKIREFLDKNPEIKNYLMMMTSSQPMRTLKKYLEHNDCLPADIVNIIGSSDPSTLTLGANEDLVPIEPGIFLIESGEIRVSLSTSTTLSGESILGAGQWFGGQSFVRPHKFNLTATTVTDLKYRFLSMKSCSRFLTPTIIDLLFDDPFLSGANTNSTIADQTTLNSVPSKKVPLEALRAMGIVIDPTILVTASNGEESAVATIYNLLSYFSVKSSKSNLKTDIQLCSKISMLNIATIIEQYGFTTTAVRGDAKKLRYQTLPGIIHYGNRFVLVIKVGKKSIIAIDPIDGFVCISFEDLVGRWDEVFLEATYADTDFIASQIEKLKVRIGKQNESAKKIASQSARLVILAVTKSMYDLKTLLVNRAGMALLAVIISAIAPLFSQFIIDEVLQFKNIETVYTLIAGSLLLTLYSTAIGIFSKFNMNDFSIRYTQKTQSMFYRHMMESTVGRKVNVGELQAKNAELAKIQSFTSDTFFQIFIAVISIAFYSLMLTKYDWRLAFTAFTSFPVLYGIRKIYRTRLNQNYVKQYEAASAMGSLGVEQISSITTIKAAAAEIPMRHRWENKFVEHTKLNRGISFEMSAIDFLINIFMNLIQVACLYFALKLASSGEITFGEMFAVNMYVTSLIGPVTGLAGLFDDIEEIRMALERLSETFKQPPQNNPADISTRHSIKITGKVKVENLSFRYKSDSGWVLKDLNFTIYPRQIVAIVGKSGCGKTTLAKILAGQLKTTSGHVFFDDFELGLISKVCLQKQIGVVMQESHLFAGSISENIAYGDDCPSEVKTIQAVHQSGAAEFVDRLPGGLGYYLSDGGGGLSGGQRQRISIARTLYTNPKLVIFDEATSALDSQSEKSVMDCIKNIQNGRTAVIIAHRLSTVKYADVILVMKDGKIVEEGNHKFLIGKKGHYSELFSEQSAVAG